MIITISVKTTEELIEQISFLHKEGWKSVFGSYRVIGDNKEVLMEKDIKIPYPQNNVDCPIKVD